MKQHLIPKVPVFKSWNEIVGLNDFSYPWSKDKPPETIFKAYYDNRYLHFKFFASGSNPLVYVSNNHKLEVINSERVEVFFRRNSNMQPYYCLEIDPYGRVLDYKARFYRQFDRAWIWPDSLQIEAKIENDGYCVNGKLSFSVLRHLGLLNKNQIQVGIFRGHCVALNGVNASLKWISWVNPSTPKPDFHVPSAFGLFLL